MAGDVGPSLAHTLLSGRHMTLPTMTLPSTLHERMLHGSPTGGRAQGRADSERPWIWSAAEARRGSQALPRVDAASRVCQ